MHPVLSALMPLRNVQGTLETVVLEWLEVLTELTPRTEIIVVDDASSDATIEVAFELMTQYPQLRVVRHAAPHGWHASLATAMERSRGDILFFPDANCALGLNELPRLWGALNRYEVILAWPGRDAVVTWEGEAMGGYQLGFRRVFEGLRHALVSRSALVAALRAAGHSFLETEVALRHPPMAVYRAACRARKLLVGPGAQRTAEAPPLASEPAQAARPSRPNYLQRLRELARGQ